MEPPGTKDALNFRHVRRRFDRAASSFDDADFLHAVTRKSLLERLEPVVVDVATILDLGSATGGATRALARRFRGARVVSVDLSHAMLVAARRKRRWRSKNTAVQANAAMLPIADQSIDLVFSNLLLPWVGNPQTTFQEVARVLRKGGLFTFATLGPDSFSLLRRAWQQAGSEHAHVNHFADMHDVGDGLVSAGLADPVLDVDRMTVSYTSPDKLFRDLTAVGARNSLSDRPKSLVGRQRFREMCAALVGSGNGGRINIELEIVCGHCWGPGARPVGNGYAIDAGQIPLRRR